MSVFSRYAVSHFSAHPSPLHGNVRLMHQISTFFGVPFSRLLVTPPGEQLRVMFTEKNVNFNRK